MDSFRCVVCNQEKPISEFTFRSVSAGERHNHCRECQKVYKRNFYLRNRKAYIDKSKREMKEKEARNRVLLREYLGTHPCVDCGEPDIVVLEFDHLRDKERMISDLVHKGVKWERVLEEIAKCEVVCANCHSKRTAQRQGRFKKLGL